jgi:uncharacterized iron-regulated membrane protein
MAKFIGKNLRVKVGSTELTTDMASVEVTETVDEIETTAFGQNARSRIAGLKDASVTLSFHQNYASGKVADTLSGVFGGTTSVVILAGTRAPLPQRHRCTPFPAWFRNRLRFRARSATSPHSM